MFVYPEQCRKARVIKDSVQSDGSIKREVVIEKGIAVRFTDLGAFIYNLDEQRGEPVFAEWFPYNCKEGVKAIIYC